MRICSRRHDPHGKFILTRDVLEPFYLVTIVSPCRSNRKITHIFFNFFQLHLKVMSKQTEAIYAKCLGIVLLWIKTTVLFLSLSNSSLRNFCVLNFFFMSEFPLAHFPIIDKSGLFTAFYSPNSSCVASAEISLRCPCSYQVEVAALNFLIFYSSYIVANSITNYLPNSHVNPKVWDTAWWPSKANFFQAFSAAFPLSSRTFTVL